MHRSYRNQSLSKQLSKIYEFLKDSESRKWNRQFQKKEFRLVLGGCQSDNERLSKLLHYIANTQASPRMNLLAKFWEQHEPYQGKTLHRFNEHLDKLRHDHADDPWARLFYGLKGQDGWGDKTAALFVKTAIQIHRGPADLHFFKEGRRCSKNLGGLIFLPVDSVISYIFQRLKFARPPTFKNINNFLHQEGYDAEDMLILDDLWFWGFFTQRVDGRGRTFQWNSQKFWSQFSSPKNDEAEVKKRAEEFISLIKA